ncbi:MAG TPA: carbohydrate-binding family 9-like protein [Flavisolibacter sp.]|jgi:hypothetical protein|nr:carbohydrate-binding family 9-like protein [Flavisolibacter sp.]
MKTLKVSFIGNKEFSDIEQLHSILNEQQKHVLEFHLWKNENDYKPAVCFSIAHNNRCILLKFFVEEKEIRSNVTKINGAVWEDSCVEFFVLFDETGYYNLEFNCIGTILAAFRKSKNERTVLSEDILKKIETSTKLNKKNNRFYWEMLIMIPVELFVRHSIQSLHGIVCKANFYKCGDGLAQPHYLAWANIKTDQPNFHLPEFFGEVWFE